jgi:hypothetical protein
MVDAAVKVIVGLSVVAVPLVPSGGEASATRVESSAMASVDDGTRKAAERFAGSFTFVGGAAEREARDAAIEDVVDDMSVFAQPIARSKLRDGNKIAERLDIAVQGDAIWVAFDGRPFLAALDGSTKRVVGILGDELDYHVEIGGTHLRQVFAGDRGGRSNAMRRSSGGKLAVDVKVTSGRLPKPLQYRLTYAPK